MAAIAFGALVSGIGVLIAGDGVEEKVPFVFPFVSMCLLLLWFAKRGTVVAISRKEGTIRRVERSMFRRRSRIYPLGDFTVVALREKVNSGEEGFLTADYSLVLEGGERHFTLLSTHDREEAVRLQQELGAFLGNSSGSRPSSGHC